MKNLTVKFLPQDDQVEVFVCSDKEILVMENGVVTPKEIGHDKPLLRLPKDVLKAIATSYILGFRKTRKKK